MVFGCGQSSDSSPEALSGHSAADDTVTVCRPLAPIETGEVFLKGKDLKPYITAKDKGKKWLFGTVGVAMLR